MRPSNSAVKTTQIQPGNGFEYEFPPGNEPSTRGFPPAPIRAGRQGNGHERLILRMYTEEQVAEMIQVSLSQLRKWRMKRNQEHPVGPPFKKLGRLVRYPEEGLQAYINGW